MRAEPTPPEQALWRALSARRLDGLKFRRQAVIEGVIVDFYCPEARLVVELDGRTHDDPDRDARRDARLLALRGLQVVRFSNQQVGLDLEGVLQTILRAARGPQTLPQPLPLQGRGEAAPLPARREGPGEGAERREARATSGRTIIGLDPGLAATGWGVIVAEGNRLRHVANGTIKTRVTEPMVERLRLLHDELMAVIAAHQPTEAAVEEVFVNSNPQSAIKLVQARGVALLCVGRARLMVAEHSTRAVKKALTGTGAAEKPQVQAMVERLLPGAQIAGSDASDALAVAIAHAHLVKNMRELMG